MNRKLLSVIVALLATLAAAAREKNVDDRLTAARAQPANESLPRPPAKPPTRHVAVPDDAHDWYLLVSHGAPKTASERQLLGWFRGEDSRLTALWNDPRIKSATTGPGYRGYRQMWYAAVLHPPAVALLDATGERIYLARGSNVPTSPATLVRELNRAIADYHARHLPHEVPAAASEPPGGAAQVGLPAAPAGRLRPLTWPFKLLRLIFGRRPCPQPPQPEPPAPADQPAPREPLAEVPDNADEPSPRAAVAPLSAHVCPGRRAGGRLEMETRTLGAVSDQRSATEGSTLSFSSSAKERKMFDFSDPVTWGVGLAGAALVALVWRVDSRLEGIKDHALELKEHADRLGLSFLSGFLKKFAIGDKSGMVTAVVQAVLTMRDPEQRLEVVRRVARAATTLLMENAAERGALLEHIDKLKRTHESQEVSA